MLKNITVFFYLKKNLIFITFILPSDVDFHLWKVHNNRFSYHNMFFSGFFNVCLKCHPYMKLYLQEHDCGISWWGRLNSIDFYSVMNMFKGFFCILSQHVIEGLRSQKIWQILLCLLLSLGINQGLISRSEIKKSKIFLKEEYYESVFTIISPPPPRPP